VIARAAALSVPPGSARSSASRPGRAAAAGGHRGLRVPRRDRRDPRGPRSRPRPDRRDRSWATRWPPSPCASTPRSAGTAMRRKTWTRKSPANGAATRAEQRTMAPGPSDGACPVSQRGREMKALLIPVDGPPRAVDLPGGGGARFMRSIRTLIGTRCAERNRITSRWEAWLDEDGAAAGKPPNQAATLVRLRVQPLQDGCHHRAGQGHGRTSGPVPGAGRCHLGNIRAPSA
jgi:hypothetical protein